MSQLENIKYEKSPKISPKRKSIYIAKSTKPTEQPIKPTEQPIKPTEQPIKPTEQPIKPTEQPIKPTEQPIKPTSIAKVIEEPDKPKITIRTTHVPVETKPLAAKPLAAKPQEQEK